MAFSCALQAVQVWPDLVAPGARALVDLVAWAALAGLAVLRAPSV